MKAEPDILDVDLAHAARYVNNWDLVDTSAPAIVGPHVVPNDLALLDQLAASSSLWERRIAMLATRHLPRLPRTTLRDAIERFPEARRRA